MRFVRILARLALFAIAAIALPFLALWLDHTRETTLRTPTGPFAVGRTSMVWTDPTRSQLMAPPNTRRQLLVTIWYPATPSSSQPSAEYLSEPWRAAIEHHTGILLSKFLTRDLSRVHTHSFSDVAVSPQQPTLPVIFLRAGLAALTADYSSLAEDLASHGYIVVGFDAPYRSFITVLPDGTVIPRSPQNNADAIGGPQKQQLATQLVQAWSADTAFALDRVAQLNVSDPRFRSRLDLDHVGIAGHSLGGATALQFCHDDARCKAGADLDGAPFGPVIAEGVTQPFFFLMSDHRGESDPDSGRITGDLDSLYIRLPPDRRLRLTLRGANHFFFSDNGALLKSPLAVRLLRALGIVRIDSRRQLAIASYYLAAFFDVHLKGAPASVLQPQPPYPEVESTP